MAEYKFTLTARIRGILFDAYKAEIIAEFIKEHGNTGLFISVEQLLYQDTDRRFAIINQGAHPDDLTLRIVDEGQAVLWLLQHGFKDLVEPVSQRPSNPRFTIFVEEKDEWWEAAGPINGVTKLFLPDGTIGYVDALLSPGDTISMDALVRNSIYAELYADGPSSVESDHD